MVLTTFSTDLVGTHVVDVILRMNMNCPIFILMIGPAAELECSICAPLSPFHLSASAPAWTCISWDIFSHPKQ